MIFFFFFLNLYTTLLLVWLPGEGPFLFGFSSAFLKNLEFGSELNADLTGSLSGLLSQAACKMWPAHTVETLSVWIDARPLAFQAINRPCTNSISHLSAATKVDIDGINKEMVRHCVLQVGKETVQTTEDQLMKRDMPPAFIK